jgi:hypothetical protein
VSERIADAPRSGAPATYTPEQICAVMRTVPSLDSAKPCMPDPVTMRVPSGLKAPEVLLGRRPITQGDARIDLEFVLLESFIEVPGGMLVDR